MKLMKIGETDILVHPLALLFVVYLCFKGYSEASLSYGAALFIHEGAHLLAACCLRIHVDKIELTPFGGVALAETYYGFKPSKQALLALAGPASNLLMVLILMSLFYLQIATPFLVAFFEANLVMLLLNLLPVLPMDGGKALGALIGRGAGAKQSTRMLAWMGMLLGGLLAALALFGVIYYHKLNLSLILTGCYLIYAAGISKRTAIAQCLHGMIAARARLEATGVIDCAVIAASSALTVTELLGKLPLKKHIRVIVINDQTLNEMGELRQQDLEKAMLSCAGNTLAELIG